MPKYAVNDFIRTARMRRRWQQRHMAQENVSHYENNHRVPTSKTVNSLLGELIDDTFLFPCLTSSSPTDFALRAQILHALEEGSDHPNARGSAQALLKQLESRLDTTDPINGQFLISCQVRLDECRHRSPNKKIIRQIDKALYLTYEDFDIATFQPELLLYEEVNLLHTLARVWVKEKNIAPALALLYKLKKGLEKMPEGDRTKEKKLAEITLTLVRVLLSNNDPNKAMQLCEEGRKLSRKRKYGHLHVEFLYHIAVYKKDPDLLRQIYFACCLLGMKTRAAQILHDAKTIFNLNINTYGADVIECKISAPQIRRGNIPAHTDLGTLIRQFRKEAGTAAKKIYHGVCTPSTYTRIERGEIYQPNVYVLEALLQRLGRDREKYFHQLLAKKDFDEMQIRDEIEALMGIRKYDEAEKLLQTLESEKNFQDGVARQCILNSKAAILSYRAGESPAVEKLLLQAIQITMPNFNEKNAAQYRMTYYEASLISKLAAYYAKKDPTRGLHLFEQLRIGLKNFYEDTSEMLGIYVVTLYNESKYRGKDCTHHNQALALIDEGEALSRYYKRLMQLPGFAVNRACILLENGNREASIPYFAMAYYGSALLGRTRDAEVTYGYVKNNLGLDFD
ncbi:MAG: helix-turn-helix domain-containing protein [Defluviitaleaceae bacterium]|nr:helix-turn-helix domain-containing protein [Defluviitaleaceae bacterium]MCL2274344.1 helix-turn-helix domain-containing protein [Defluviitaleaceae bacterium]